MKLIRFALSSIALAGLAAANAAVADDEWVDVYGKIMLTIDKIDQDNAASPSERDQWELNSNASRFGVKGKGEAGEGLEAFYQLEWEINLTDKGGADENMKSRNQIVGLRGGFGEVFAGRHDTPTKKLQKEIDIFGDLSGDIKHSFNAEKRMNNIVQYSTPNIGRFKAKLAVIPGEGSAQADGSGINDGIADAISIALEYKTANLNLGISRDADVEGDGIDTTRLMAQYKMGAWQFGLMFQDTDNNGADGNGFMASIKYKMGKNIFKIQLIDSDAWQTGVSSKVKYSSQSSLGWDRKLGKKTTVFTYLTLSEEGVTGDDDSIFGVGIVQKF